MKVIAFNGSPHQSGVITRGMSIMRDELVKEGIETRIEQIGDKMIHGCMACRGCMNTGRCVIDDDVVNNYRDMLASVEGIILGSPVYYGGIAGTFKCFLDRLFYPRPDLKYKIGASVVSLRRTGGISAFHQLNNYFNLAQMIISPGMYWEVIHGNTAEEFEQDEEGIQLMEIQGRNMAWLIKALAAGLKEVPLPPQTGRKRTNFVRETGRMS